MVGNVRNFFSSEAESDIEEAVQWYEDQREGLGFQFVTHFQEALSLFEMNPKLFAIIYKEVRSVLIDKFPYSIFYSISETPKRIYIFAVVHTSRNPEIWKLRADKA